MLRAMVIRALLDVLRGNERYIKSQARGWVFARLMPPSLVRPWSLQWVLMALELDPLLYVPKLQSFLSDPAADLRMGNIRFRH